jgi:hypothetical protein
LSFPGLFFWLNCKGLHCIFSLPELAFSCCCCESYLIQYYFNPLSIS